MGQKVASFVTLVISFVLKLMNAKPTKEELTKNLYSLLPKGKYVPKLYHVSIDGKGTQVNDTNSKKIIAEINERFKKAKSIVLTFIAEVKLSQEVVIMLQGKRVKTNTIAIPGQYDLKAREYNILVPGWDDQFNKEERDLVYWRADMGLVQFAQDNKLKHVYGTSAMKEEKE